MLNRMFTYVTSRSARRVRSVAVVTSGALFAGLMVTIGAGPSVAQSVDPTVLCGMCLTEPAVVAVSVTGSSKLTVNGGGVYANSNAAPAVSVTGSSKIVTNAQVRAAGTIVKTGSSTISGTPAAGLTAPLFADPYPGRLPVLSVGPNNATTDYTQSGGQIPTRADGLYRDVSLSGSGTFTFPDAHRYRDVTVGGSVTAALKPGRYRNVTFGGSSKITLTPGVYWFAGSLSVTSSSKVTGTDASLVLACGTPTNDLRACNNETGGKLLVSGSSQLALNGNTPTTPSISFAPGNNADLTIDGSSKLILASSGIDAPNAFIVVTGSSSLTAAGLIHARRASITGSSTITATVIPAPPATTTTTIAASTSTSTSAAPTTTTIPTTTSPPPASSSTTTTVAAGTTTTTLPTTTTSPPTTTSTAPPSPNDLDVSNDATLLCQLSSSIVGTEGPDLLVGTPGADVICGLGGHDQITGLGGDDLVFGGQGNDVLEGGDGADSLYGENGDDSLFGQGEPDALVGGQGNDHLYGGTGNDVLHGEVGDDSFQGDEDDDRIFGGSGADVATGGPGNDFIAGDEGTDTANGSDGLDVCKTAETAISCEGPRPLAPPGQLSVSGGSAALQVGSPGGILASDLAIETLPTTPALSAWQIGDTYEITNRSGVKPTSIVLTISVPAIGPLDEYSIVTLDELTGVWVDASLNQIRDGVANTIAVQLEHFSPYAVVRKKVAAIQPPKSLRCIGPDFGRNVEVDLLVDSSGSLDLADSAELRTEAIQRILETLPNGSTLRIVEFDRTPRQIFAGTLTDVGYNLALVAASDIGAFGGGNEEATSASLLTSLDLLSKSAARYRAAILLSDGELAIDARMGDVQTFARSKDLAVHVLDFNLNGSAELTALVNSTGGQLARLPNGSTEHDVVEKADQILEPVFDSGSDFDADGITDCEERYGAVLLDTSAQIPFSTSFISGSFNSTDDDQDDDKVLDGIELPRLAPDLRSVQIQDLRDQYLREPRIFLSSPLDATSDTDQEDDWTEHTNGTNPRVNNNLLAKYEIWSDKEVVETVSAVSRCYVLIITFACDRASTATAVRNQLRDDLKLLGAWKNTYSSATIGQLHGLLLERALVAEASLAEGVSPDLLIAFGSRTKEGRRSFFSLQQSTVDVAELVTDLRVLGIKRKVVFASLVVLALASLVIFGPVLAGGAKAIWAASLAEMTALGGGTATVIEKYTKIPAQAQLATLNAMKLACEALCDDGTQAGLNAMEELSPKSMFDDTLELAKKALVSPGSVQEFSVIAQNGRRIAYSVGSEFDPSYVHDGIANAERIIAGQIPFSKASDLPLQIERIGDDLVVFGAEGIPLGISGTRRAFRKVLPPTSRPKNLTDANWRSLQNLQQTQSIWRLKPRPVGIAFEGNVCGPNQIGPANQKALDCFDVVSGLATSVKTFNFHRKTYRESAKKGSDTLNKYLGQLANYTRTQGDNYINDALIRSKVLHIGIPPGPLPLAYQTVFTQLRARAATLNITIVIETIS
jgi:Ca2+-binding RTX toxin-like protein